MRFSWLILSCLACAGGCASTREIVLMKYSPAIELAKSESQPGPERQRSVFSAIQGRVDIVRCAPGGGHEKILKSYVVNDGIKVGFERVNDVLFAVAGADRIRLEEGEYEWRSERRESSMDPALKIFLIPAVVAIQLTSILLTGDGYCP